MDEPIQAWPVVVLRDDQVDRIVQAVLKALDKREMDRRWAESLARVGQ